MWIARNRFAVLDKSRQIVIKNMDNETTKKVVPPTPTVDMLFNGGAAGRILLRSEDKLILFEQQSRRVLGEISAPKLKQVVWTSDGSKVSVCERAQRAKLRAVPGRRLLRKAERSGKRISG